MRSLSLAEDGTLVITFRIPEHQEQNRSVTPYNEIRVREVLEAAFPEAEFDQITWHGGNGNDGVRYAAVVRAALEADYKTVAACLKGEHGVKNSFWTVPKYTYNGTNEMIGGPTKAQRMRDAQGLDPKTHPVQRIQFLREDTER